MLGAPGDKVGLGRALSRGEAMVEPPGVPVGRSAADGVPPEGSMTVPLVKGAVLERGKVGSGLPVSVGFALLGVK